MERDQKQRIATLSSVENRRAAATVAEGVGFGPAKLCTFPQVIVERLRCKLSI
jgi:hypothetical protein